MEGRSVAMDISGEELLETRRIFVGGLSDKVTEEDLHKTFSSLGTLEGVDFVKTSGRSFAYIDFQPSSTKSLAKLFSSYNGCVWKGGRLRLEKAKEHYLVRLKREWEEEAVLPHKSNDKLVADEKKHPPKKAKLLSLENKQLQIFFPKLRKVKAVPFSGTGKHKYSFQRIEVPSSLPIHFCDCEEHGGSAEIAKAKHISNFEDQAGNVNEEEVSMMASVMNKIFKRETNLSTDYSKVILPMLEGNSNQTMDHTHPNESDVDQDSDADNLVINIVSGGNAISGSVEMGRLENVNQESMFARRQISSVGSTQNTIEFQKDKKNDLTNSSGSIPKKQHQLLPSEGGNRNQFTSDMAKKRRNQETYSEETKGPLASQPSQKGSGQLFLTGLLRRQKSSWKALGGEADNTSFSISHILPDATLEQNIVTSNGFTGSTTEDKQQKVRKKARRKSTNSEPVEPTVEETLQESVSKDGPSIDAHDVIKQAASESAGSELATLVKSEVRQDRISTDAPSTAAVFEMPPQNSEIAKKVQPSGQEGGKVSTNAHSTVIRCETPSNESEIPKEVQPTDNKSGNHQAIHGQSWMQKSSWKELVGERDSSSFSISHILPASERQKLQTYGTRDAVNSTDNKQKNTTNQFTNNFFGNGFSGVGKFGMLHDGIPPTGSIMAPTAKKRDTSAAGSDGTTYVERNSENEKKDNDAGSKSDGTTYVERNSENEKKDNDAGSKSSGGENMSALNKKAPVDAGTGEVCTFMRSKESEKEWKKLSAALGAPLKKKINK